MFNSVLGSPSRHPNYSQIMPEINNSTLSNPQHHMSVADTIESQLTSIKQNAKWTKKQAKHSNVMLKKCEKFMSRNNKLHTLVDSALDQAKRA